MAKRWEVKGCYYGINIQTLEVERVVRRAEGIYTLCRAGVIEVRFFPNPVGAPELRYLFDLRDTHYVHCDVMGTAHERQVRSKLSALAEHYRQEAA